MSNTNATLTNLRDWTRQQARTYSNGDERPLAGYLQLMSVYATGSLSGVAVARLTGRRPQQLSPWDVVQLAVATHKVSRLIAKDPVTSPFRAPFTRFEGVSAPSELHEEVRGHGLRHSVGELLTCPLCLAQWVATGFSIGLVFSPRFVRQVLSTFTAIAGADFLQHVYVKLQQATD